MGAPHCRKLFFTELSVLPSEGITHHIAVELKIIDHSDNNRSADQISVVFNKIC